MADVTCVTNEHLNDPVEIPADVKTLTITGVHLPKNLTKEDLRIGAPGEVEVVALEQKDDVLTVQIRILQCIPGKKEINIKGIQACDLLTFIKVITNAPNMGVRTKVFDCIRAIGTSDSVPMIQRSENVHTRFAEQCWQIFNVTEVCYADPTKMTYPTSGAAGGECANAATGIVGGTCSAGGYGHTEWYVQEETPSTEVCDQDPAAVKIDIRMDTNMDNAITEADNAKERVPGKFMAMNKDNDNRNLDGNGDEIIDGLEEGPVAGEDDLRRLEIHLTPSDLKRGKVRLWVDLEGVSVWKHREKGKETNVIDGSYQKYWDLSNDAERKEFEDFRRNLWVEGVKGSVNRINARYYDARKTIACILVTDSVHDEDLINLNINAVNIAVRGLGIYDIPENSEEIKGRSFGVGELVKITLAETLPDNAHGGRIRLVQEGGGGTVRLWTDQWKNTPFPLPAERDWKTEAPFPMELYVEGVTPGRVVLRYEYVNADWNDEGHPYTCPDKVLIGIMAVEFIDTAEADVMVPRVVGGETQEVAERTDLLPLFNPAPVVTLDPIPNPGTAPSVNVPVAGRVRSFIAPIAKIFVNRQEIAVTPTASGVDIGPFDGTFTTPLPLGDGSAEVSAMAVNALNNLGYDRSFIRVAKDAAGNIAARQVFDGIGYPSTEPNLDDFRFRIEVIDPTNAAADVEVTFDTGLEQRTMKLAKDETSGNYRSRHFYLVPENLRLPADASPEVRETRIMARFGIKPKVTYRRDFTTCQDKGIVTGILMVDPVTLKPVDLAMPGNPETADNTVSYSVIAGAVGKDAATDRPTIEVTARALDVAGNMYPAPFGVLPLSVQSGIVLRRQSDTLTDDKFHLYKSERKVTATTEPFPAGRTAADYPDYVVMYTGSSGRHLQVEGPLVGQTTSTEPTLGIVIYGEDGLDDRNRVFTRLTTAAPIRGEAPPVRLRGEPYPYPLLPAGIQVQWEAIDVDDPADHVHLDPNDQDTEDNDADGTADNNDGNDNSGTRTAAHFFTGVAGYAISEQTETSHTQTVDAAQGGANRPVTSFDYYNDVWAKTALDAAKVTKALFNASNDGGDNFRIRGWLTMNDAPVASMETFPQEPVDAITVWRRMNVLVYAMNRRDPLAEIIRPGPNGHLEFGSVLGRGGDDVLQNVVIHPGADGTMESVIAGDDVANAAGTISPGVNDRFDTPIAGTDEYRGVILAGANGIAETTAVPDDIQVVAINAGTYYPFDGGEGAAGVFDAFRNAYGDGGGTSDQAGYIEMNVQDAQTRASMGSDFTHREPYALAGGQTLDIRIDGNAAVTVTFNAGPAFPAGVGSATAAQVAAVINGTVGLAGVAREVRFDRDGVTAQLCLRAPQSIEIVGGAATGPLGLPVGEMVTRNHTRYIDGINYTYATTTTPDWDVQIEQYVRLQTDYHQSDANPPPNVSDTPHIVGVRRLLSGSYGTTKRQPHSLVNVDLHETRGFIHNDTAIHEPGHSLSQNGANFPLADDFHERHTTGDAVVDTDDHPCFFSNRSDNTTGRICERHLRLLRNSIYRTWTGPAGDDRWNDRD